MHYLDERLQWPDRVTTPEPLFARQLQRAIGGMEGEVRACMQYFFQAWLPIPNSFPREKEAKEHAYGFVASEQEGGAPVLGPAQEGGKAQAEQIEKGPTKP